MISFENALRAAEASGSDPRRSGSSFAWNAS
jgi:hypothetical protein